MNSSIISEHDEKVSQLQATIRQFAEEKKVSTDLPFLSWTSSSHSNTTRAKSYKAHCSLLQTDQLNEILSINPEGATVLVEPLVTMEQLITALLPHGLTVPVVPEFKGITVGGAIMGAAGESSSFRWGCFHDNCVSIEILCGDGTLLKASREQNSDLFHGIAGSYGTFGLLVSAELRTIPVPKSVRIRTYSFSDPQLAIGHIRKSCTSQNPPDFLDGIIFSPHHACVMEGWIQNDLALPSFIPQFSFKERWGDWYSFHVMNISQDSSITEEVMLYEDYAFRYDLGCFWMGAYLLQTPIFIQYLFHRLNDHSLNAAPHLQKYHAIRPPGYIKRCLSRPWMSSKQLYSLLHGSESWVKDRFVIQDFCLPEEKAPLFYEQIEMEPAIFPIWMCPILGTTDSQLFAPHLLTRWHTSSHFINFGLYGIPDTVSSTNDVLKHLETLTTSFHGRKVLYSHSAYTPDEFWRIYPKSDYEALRQKCSAEGTWIPLTDKVLST